MVRILKGGKIYTINAGVVIKVKQDDTIEVKLIEIPTTIDATDLKFLLLITEEK